LQTFTKPVFVWYTSSSDQWQVVKASIYDYLPSQKGTQFFMKTLAELVNDLFQTHRRPDGREYTYKEVTVALDGVVEPSHLSKLRTGKITNPGRETLLSLCRFFNIAPTYFFPELDALPRSSSRQPVATQVHSLRLALRSAGLQPEVEEKLEELIVALQQAKQL
jgi:transcriptional regulator with XRE-family HTH domain